MRKFLLGVLLLPALAFAEPVQVNTTVVCDKASDMLSYFAEKYQEQPLWMGNAEVESNVVLLVNQESQTWTIIQFDAGKNIACFLGSGQGFKFKLPGDPT